MVLKSKVTKKINPTDEELLKKIKIKKINFNINEIRYIIELISNNEMIGFAKYDPNLKYIFKVLILDNYRRKGLATFLYNYIEQDQNLKLKPSHYLLEDGAEFWKNRLIKNPSLKPKPKNARPLKTPKTKASR